MSSPRLVDRRAALAVAGRPHLWWPALRTTARMAPRGWWRRWPPLPNPSGAYAEFRLHTMLGGPGDGARPLDAAEVLAFLEWCRAMEVLAKGRRRELRH